MEFMINKLNGKLFQREVAAAEKAILGYSCLGDLKKIMV